MVDRPVDRPHAPVDRAGRRSQPRVGSLQSVDRPVDRSHPAVDRTGRPLRCACQRAHRSTGPVDRATASADGRPGRSTVRLFCCFLLLLNSGFPSSLRRLPRRLPPLTILHLGEDFSNLSRSPTYPSLSPGEIDTRSRRNRHTISAYAHRTKSTHDLGEIDTRSRRNRHTISAWNP